MIFSDAAFNDLPDTVPHDQALWPFKHTNEQLLLLKKGDKHTYYPQYQQLPRSPELKMFDESFWKFYDMLPADIDVVRIYCDTAQKTENRHDYSVFQCWGRSLSKGIFLIDQCRGKFEAPLLESMLVEFWKKHRSDTFNPVGAQIIKIEDKSSGSSLIQRLKKDYFFPVEAIPRHHDKFMRAFGIVNYIEQGYVHLPADSDFTYDYIEEFSKFNAFMNHKHDDQIDPTIDAINDLLVSENCLYTEQSVGNR